MSQFLSAVRIPQPVSVRTLKYVEALTREGDNFDYYKWLERVREEEAQAKQAPTAITPREVVTPRVENPIKAPSSWDVRPSLGRAPIGIPVPNSRALRRLHQDAQSKTPKDQLRRWLEKVHHVSGEFQGSRERDAVYEYLAAVFAIVMHYKVRRRTKRLLRHAFKFANLPFDKNADPFSAVIRCTSEGNVDSKAISKWARALRYVARSKEPDTELRKFMKGAGGINGCAARYAHSNGRTC